MVSPNKGERHQYPEFGRPSDRCASVWIAGNAVVCGLISGPHDRYGARTLSIATFVALIAAARAFAKDDELLPPRQEVDDPGLVDLVADRAHMVAVRNVEHLRTRNDPAER
ncbi:hypothetical protein ACVIW0_002993 [Bradyrhizobium sp. USDA 4454]